MHDLVQHEAVAFAVVRVAEDAPAERGSVEWASSSPIGGCGLEEEIGRAGPEVVDYGFVACGAGFDDLAGD